MSRYSGTYAATGSLGPAVLSLCEPELSGSGPAASEPPSTFLLTLFPDEIVRRTVRLEGGNTPHSEFGEGSADRTSGPAEDEGFPTSPLG